MWTKQITYLNKKNDILAIISICYDLYMQIVKSILLTDMPLNKKTQTKITYHVWNVSHLKSCAVTNTIIINQIDITKIHRNAGRKCCIKSLSIQRVTNVFLI
jgi:hypothetical protein